MTKPYLQTDGVTLFHGDCLNVLRELPDESVQAVVTDPPYGLEFMGREWDGADGFRRSLNAADAGRENVFGRASRTSPEYRAGSVFEEWCEAWARECLRILKPGGHLLAFGGSRTWHRLASGIEDAGFELRDSIAWLYGSGFPKSLDVAKAIDATVLHGGSNSKRLREAEQAGDGETYTMTGKNNGIMGETVTVERKTWQPETDQAKTWNGWGTALKPAFEPIIVARKPLIGTVASNVITHGTGALNIDANRTAAADAQLAEKYASVQKAGPRANAVFGADTRDRAGAEPNDAGRWPMNVVLDASQATALGEPAFMFPTFRYEAKAPTSERPVVDGVAHPTVKPLDLMRWLVRLVTPKGGTVLEPFAGSGTTVEACLREGFDCIAIEREADYLPLIEKRIRKDHAQGLDFDWGDAS